MLRNYLKTTIRSLLRHKIYTIINLLGLVFGMTAIILIYLYTRDELSYDSYHSKAEQIYRINYDYEKENKLHTKVLSSYILGPTIQKELKGVKAQARIFKGSNKKPLTYKNRRLYANGMLYADNSIFEIFDFDFIQGDPKTALKDTNSVVLTRSMAVRLFGSARAAMGKEFLLFDYQNNKVTGIIEDLPHNSHLQFPALISMKNVEALMEKQKEYWWYMYNTYTYILLDKNASVGKIESKIEKIYDKHVPKEKEEAAKNIKNRHKLEPLLTIHLGEKDKLGNERFKIGDTSYIYIFLVIGIFILLLACINYMNLATARSALRAKEVGVRKVLGAYRTKLIQQFFGESFLLSFFALFISIGLVELILPYFNQAADKSLAMPYFSDPLLFLWLFGVALLVGFLSGSYPAFYLSKFNPVVVLKGKLETHRSSVLFRKFLVIFQFAVSISMIIATWVIHDQLNYLRNKNLGFNKDYALVTEVFNLEVLDEFYDIKKDLLKNPKITAVASTNAVPGTDDTLPEISVKTKVGNKTETLFPKVLFVDEDFANMMELTLLRGRLFSNKIEADTQKVLINETMLEICKWDKGNALGRKIDLRFDEDGEPTQSVEVVGIVKNFHLSSLHEPIEPLLMFLNPKISNHIIMRVLPKDIKKTKTYIANIWDKYDKKYAFDSYFLDENFAREYREDAKLGKVFMTFTVLTIFIACLGLFGLASFTAEQRLKEIGIRKVLGASVPNILSLISKDFLRLVLWANLIAFPVAYLIMNTWLSDFAYHTEINYFIFLLAGFVALSVALLAISTQALKVATSNPAHVLKDE